MVITSYNANWLKSFPQTHIWTQSQGEHRQWVEKNTDEFAHQQT